MKGYWGGEEKKKNKQEEKAQKTIRENKSRM